MIRKTLLFALCLALAVGCKKDPEDIPGRDPNGNGGGGDKPAKVTVVVPTTDLGKDTDDISLLKLTPGKLITLSQAGQESVCKRLVKEGMYMDIIVSDDEVFKDGITDEKVEELFSKAANAIKATGAKVWGMHLPHTTIDLAREKEEKRLENVADMIRLTDLSLKYLKPHHLVTHPSGGNGNTRYTFNSKYETWMANSQKSLVSMQQALDASNKKYGTKAILCVENCPRQVAYDHTSMLELLSAPGLEKVKVCFDTGHALTPLNADYITHNSPYKATKNGDPVAMLKAFGDRIGTVHINENNGMEMGTSVEGNTAYDIHFQPIAGSKLIDWGEVYYQLLSTCHYRGCFLYEVSQVTEGGEKASIESSKKNYEEVVYPAFQKRVQK